mmetsp:Transcript_103971/g.299365  ORF Transcript_103971/g.299365 Transcript_103971/m.299365 type:complete len:201 (+) Transcript_103971:1785-2387(+)
MPTEHQKTSCAAGWMRLSSDGRVGQHGARQQHLSHVHGGSSTSGHTHANFKLHLPCCVDNVDYVPVCSAANIDGLADLDEGVHEGKNDRQDLHRKPHIVFGLHKALQTERPELHIWGELARLTEIDAERDDGEEAHVGVEYTDDGLDLSRLLVNPTVLLQLPQLQLGARAVHHERNLIAVQGPGVTLDPLVLFRVPRGAE